MSTRALRLCFWAALAAATLLALLPQPPALPGGPSDKVQHALGFALLSVALVLAYPRLAVPHKIAALAAYGAALELAQLLLPALNRSGELADWLVDLAAVLVAVPAAELLHRRLRR